MWNDECKSGLKENTFKLEDIVKLLKHENNFIRDGYGYMWKIENNKVFYKPQNINNFFEVKIKGTWFIDPIEVLEVKNYKNK